MIFSLTSKRKEKDKGKLHRVTNYSNVISIIVLFTLNFSIIFNTMNNEE